MYTEIIGYIISKKIRINYDRLEQKIISRNLHSSVDIPERLNTDLDEQIKGRRIALVYN